MCYMTDVKDQNIMRPVKGRPDWYGTWHLASRGCMSYEERKRRWKNVVDTGAAHMMA